MFPVFRFHSSTFSAYLGLKLLPVLFWKSYFLCVSSCSAAFDGSLSPDWQHLCLLSPWVPHVFVTFTSCLSVVSLLVVLFVFFPVSCVLCRFGFLEYQYKPEIDSKYGYFVCFKFNKVWVNFVCYNLQFVPLGVSTPFTFVLVHVRLVNIQDEKPSTSSSSLG